MKIASRIWSTQQIQETMAVMKMMMTMRENVVGNCVHLWNYIQCLSLGIFIFWDIHGWVADKNLRAHSDPWMKCVLNIQCTLFKRKLMICKFLHLLALPKVTKILMQSAQQRAHISKLSYLSLLCLQESPPLNNSWESLVTVTVKPFVWDTVLSYSSAVVSVKGWNELAPQ